jgi:hypothetical protein
LLGQAKQLKTIPLTRTAIGKCEMLDMVKRKKGNAEALRTQS